MSNSSSEQKSETLATEAGTTKVTPLRCLLGAVISGGFAIALYSLTYSIAQTFGAKPVTSTNELVIRIAVVVRTLVIGMTALGTFIFGLVALGLVLLAIQLSIQSLKKRSLSP